MEHADRQNVLERKIAEYQHSTDTIRLVQSTPILLLVGISGAGKDTIKHKLLETRKYHHIISHTTRAPRMNHGTMEQNGVEYHFISLEQAEELLDRGGYIEAKMYSGNIYGTSVSEIETAKKSGKIAVTDLEVQGVTEYMKMSPTVTAAFILPPSYEEWRRRVLKRYEGGQIDQIDMQRRLDTAILELEHALATNSFHFVINKNLDETVGHVDTIAHHQGAPAREQEAHDLAVELLSKIRARI